MRHHQVLLCVLTSVISGRQLRSVNTASVNWDTILSRYNLGSPAAWQTLSTAAGRRDLETAVDWRSLTTTAGGQYAAAVGGSQYAGSQNAEVAAGLAVGGQSSGRSLLEGTFRMVDNNNFDRYLEELGVELLLRQLAVIANPSVTISRCSKY